MRPEETGVCQCAARRQVPAARAAIKSGHEAMAVLSTRGTLITVPDSAHAIAVQKPKVVIDAVVRMIDEVRASGAAAGR